jgi:hypothetical protein
LWLVAQAQQRGAVRGDQPAGILLLAVGVAVQKHPSSDTDDCGSQVVGDTAHRMAQWRTHGEADQRHTGLEDDKQDRDARPGPAGQFPAAPNAAAIANESKPRGSTNANSLSTLAHQQKIVDARRAGYLGVEWG